VGAKTIELVDARDSRNLRSIGLDGLGVYLTDGPAKRLKNDNAARPPLATGEPSAAGGRSRRRLDGVEPGGVVGALAVYAEDGASVRPLDVARLEPAHPSPAAPLLLRFTCPLVAPDIMVAAPDAKLDANGLPACEMGLAQRLTGLDAALNGVRSDITELVARDRAADNERGEMIRAELSTVARRLADVEAAVQQLGQFRFMRIVDDTNGVAAAARPPDGDWYFTSSHCDGVPKIALLHGGVETWSVDAGACGDSESSDGEQSDNDADEGGTIGGSSDENGGVATKDSDSDVDADAEHSAGDLVSKRDRKAASAKTTARPDATTTAAAAAAALSADAASAGMPTVAEASAARILIDAEPAAALSAAGGGAAGQAQAEQPSPTPVVMKRDNTESAKQHSPDIAAAAVHSVAQQQQMPSRHGEGVPVSDAGQAQVDVVPLQNAPDMVPMESAADTAKLAAGMPPKADSLPTTAPGASSDGIGTSDAVQAAPARAPSVPQSVADGTPPAKSTKQSVAPPTTPAQTRNGIVKPDMPPPAAVPTRLAPLRDAVRDPRLRRPPTAAGPTAGRSSAPSSATASANATAGANSVLPPALAKAPTASAPSASAAPPLATSTAAPAKAREQATASTAKPARPASTATVPSPSPRRSAHGH
jgi:hypothetical protein